MPAGLIDVGKEFNLRQQSAADILAADPLQLNGGAIGFNIADANARFPNTMAMLTEAGFNNTEKLESCYAWCAIQECCIMTAGGWAGDGWAGRTPVYIPSGVWITNREIRAGQQRIEGDGPGFNYGTGGTLIQRVDTDWKSIHGAQNDHVRIILHPHTYCGENGTTVGSSFHLGIGAGQEWCHYFHVTKLAMRGTGGPAVFADPADYVEVAIMYYGPGECSHIDNVDINHIKGFPIMVDGKTAPSTVGPNVSLFNNSIAGIGQSTGALGKITYTGLSGDNNPYMLFLFRRGSNALGDGNPFMPGLTWAPGGQITMNDTKIEAFACRSAYAGLDPCFPTSYVGRGGRLARLTGRFDFAANGFTLNVHGPTGRRLFTALEVVDEWFMSTIDPGGGWGANPLSNSRVKLHGGMPNGVETWLHDWKRQRAFTIPGDGVPQTQVNMLEWEDLNDAVAFTRRAAPSNNIVHPFISATYRGRQPFLSGLQARNANAAPSVNYDEIFGNNYP